MTPIAAADEHTDLSSGIADPLHVYFRPPESGIGRFVPVESCVLMPAAVTGSVEPFMAALSRSTGVTPSAWLLLTFGFPLTFGANSFMMKAYSASSAFEDAVEVVMYEPASALSRVGELRMLGSWHVESTYLGSLSPSVLYACRNDVQSVTSPTMPTASAPLDTADCICGLMSAVPSLTGTT